MTEGDDRALAQVRRAATRASLAGTVAAVGLEVLVFVVLLGSIRRVRAVEGRRPRARDRAGVLGGRVPFPPDPSSGGLPASVISHRSPPAPDAIESAWGWVRPTTTGEDR
jgi:hypothetical protein